MKHHIIWQSIKNHLGGDSGSKNISAVLVCVVNHSGSSPGKQGFKMVILERDGNYDHLGTIGGGVMEYNLITKSEEIIENQKEEIIFRELIHSSTADPDKQSGLVCAGKQDVAIIPIKQSDKKMIGDIVDAYLGPKIHEIRIYSDGMSIIEVNNPLIDRYSYSAQDYVERIGRLIFDTVILFGGGHVGHALSYQLQHLNFYTILAEYRSGIPLIQNNKFVQEKMIGSYDKLVSDIFTMINNGSLLLEKIYFVIVTTDLVNDLEVLRSIFDNIDQNQINSVKYIGVMGSKGKLAKIFDRLSKNVPSSKEDLHEKIFAPIGIDINSGSVEEIALSISAQLVKIKNIK